MKDVRHRTSHLEIDHLPEAPEVLAGGLLLPLLVLTVVHQAGELDEPLGHDQTRLAQHTADLALQLYRQLRDASRQVATHLDLL